MLKKYLLLTLLVGAAAPQTNHAATSENWEIGPFRRPVNAEPVIKPNADSSFDCPMREEKIYWERKHTFNPAAIVKDGKIYVLYRAEDDQGQGIGGYTSRLGLAESTDGIHFKTLPTPVFYPDKDSQMTREWYGGCEDPRLLETEDGTYVLFYTQYWRSPSGRGTDLGIATSKDLLHWEKQGPMVVKKEDGALTLPNKSASPVCEVRNGRLIASRIDGRYWVYYGEKEVHLASSKDLKIWNYEGVMLTPREGCFDSDFPESGPAAVLTDKGIVLMYNGKNAHGDNRDKDIPPGAYCGGQVLFDAKNPAVLLDHPKKPFFKPELPWEASGQYKDGTTFIEGLVFFKNKWFLYYGCADTFVGVAIAEAK